MVRPLVLCLPLNSSSERIEFSLILRYAGARFNGPMRWIWSAPRRAPLLRCADRSSEPDAGALHAVACGRGRRGDEWPGAGGNRSRRRIAVAASLLWRRHLGGGAVQARQPQHVEGSRGRARRRLERGSTWNHRVPAASSSAGGRARTYRGRPFPMKDLGSFDGIGGGEGRSSSLRRKK